MKRNTTNDIIVTTSKSPNVTACNLPRPPEFQFTEGGEVPEIARIRAEVFESMRKFFLDDQDFTKARRTLESLRSRADTSSYHALVILDEARKALSSCDKSEGKIREYLKGCAL
ncbi:MAG: hypothetical protein WCI03_03690 [bacterium]